MKHRLPLIAILALTSSALLPGCDRESRAGESPTAAQKAKDALDSAIHELQKSYDDARPTIDRDLQELKTRAESAGEAARSEMEKALADLETRRKALAAKFEELKTRAPDEAQAMLDRLKSELDSLKASASEAAKK